MTEDEARKKWCPFARVADSPHVAGNRYPFDTDYSEKKAFATCLASDCMAWRWDRHWNVEVMAEARSAWDDYGERVGEFIGSPQWREANAMQSGVCGLAGEDDFTKEPEQ